MRESNPNPSSNKSSPAPLNTMLGNTVNSALTADAQTCLKLYQLTYSERLTESGVMLRGPGVARCPEAV